MTYYKEIFRGIEELVNETVANDGIEGAFSRVYVEQWLDKPFEKLEDPSYDEDRTEIDKMDHIFSVVAVYKIGLRKGYIPEYAKELLNNFIESRFGLTFETFLMEDDKLAFKQDFECVRDHMKINGVGS